MPPRRHLVLPGRDEATVLPSALASVADDVAAIVVGHRSSDIMGDLRRLDAKQHARGGAG
jgi:hypothetical protein